MFLATRMWIDTLINRYLSDSSGIPKDIGNMSLCQSNLYMTKKGISMYIQINEWSAETDSSFTSAMVDFIKSQVREVDINFIYKPSKVNINLKDADIEANIMLWERALDREQERIDKQGLTAKPMSYNTKRQARCLFSVEEIKHGARTLNLQTIIEVRGKDSKTTRRAFKVACMYLTQNDIEFTKLNMDLRRYLQFIKMTYSGKTKIDKEVPKALFSTETLAQTLPTVQGKNAERGLYLGQDIINKSPYFIDLSGGRAKNIYILGESGSGKTVAMLYLATMASLSTYNISVSDIKGNEFSGLIRSIGGNIVSLRVTDPTYVNIWRLDPEQYKSDNEYFTRMYLYNKQLLYTIIDPSEQDETKCNSFISDFMNVVYLRLGLTENPNTWGRTQNFHPKQYYDYLRDFLSEDVRERYGEVASRAEINFREFLSPHGNMSYLFNEELEYNNVVKGKYVSFDFGLLKSATHASEKTARKIKFLWHNIINNDFIADKFINCPDTETIVVDEESQIVGKDMLKRYALDFTIRRAQRCKNVLLGNSMRAILEVEEAKSMFDNINIIMIGKINNDNIKLVQDTFDLTDKGMAYIKAIHDEEDTGTSYFYVKDNSRKSIDTIVNVQVPSSYFNNCRIFMKE